MNVNVITNVLQVSIGFNGNPKCEAIDRTACCTPAITPMITKGYQEGLEYGHAMPWGSHKPCAEVDSLFFWVFFLVILSVFGEIRNNYW